MILKTACERLLSSFMFVAATVRDLFPSDIRDSMSWNTKQKLVKIIPLQHWECVSEGVEEPCSWTQRGGTDRLHTAQTPYAPGPSMPAGSWEEHHANLFIRTTMNDFTHPQGILGVYDFLLSDESNRSYIKKKNPCSSKHLNGSRQVFFVQQSKRSQIKRIHP